MAAHQRVALSDATVVFLGESGVGKKRFARAIHEKSSRSKEAFIEVNAEPFRRRFLNPRCSGMKRELLLEQIERGSRG